MSATAPNPGESESERWDAELESWRFRFALDLGYTFEQAFGLSERHEVDLHDLARLIHRGCDPTLALEIIG